MKYAILSTVLFIASLGFCIYDLRAASIPVNASVKIAILQFDALGNPLRENESGRIASEFMTTNAVNIGVFEVVEREAIRKILDEMEFGESGKSFSSIAQKIGQLSGAKYVLSGSISAYKDSIRIDARLIRVADGKIEFAQGSFAKSDLESIYQATRSIVMKLTEQYIQNIGQMIIGQAAWTSAEALMVDGNEKLWINPDFGIRLEKDQSSCMKIILTESGVEVNVMGCNKKWQKRDKMTTDKLYPVSKIVY